MELERKPDLDERTINDLVERRLHSFMVDWLYELDTIGMGHVPIAQDMRRMVDAEVLAEPPRNRRAGDRAYLRVVREGAS